MSTIGHEAPQAVTAPGGETLPGLVMDFPLTVPLILRRMAGVHGSSKVVTLLDPESGACSEHTFAEVAGRVGQLAHALQRLGVRPGDRVASLAWNNTQHLETYYAVMGVGAVLHTMNLRLFGEQLAWTVNHAQDRVVIVDASLAAQLAEVLPLLTTVETVIVVKQPGEECTELPDALDYEELLRAESPDFGWPDIDERAAASLCYTSGTTGDPKGVLYSHRSIVLHALAMTGADVYGLTSRDRVLSLVPLFHAMGWGLPFVCGLVGSDLVMPGPHLKPQPLSRLIQEQRITWSCGVPTLWLDMLHYARQREEAGSPVDLSTLHTVLCGGTAVPESLMKTYEDRYGVAILQGWGMTEIFPGVTVARDEPGHDEDQRWERRKAQGRLSPLYELRLVDSQGAVVPHDGVSVGEIQVRGPAVAGAYFGLGDEAADKFDDGWLRTGDIGTLDEGGWMRITDRAKDAIKSGGEWISSVDLENELMAHPAVREAAVIGKPDERWSERPLAYVVLSADATQEDLVAFLRTRVAKWWVPEDFRFVEAIPRTATGKFDKKVLRAMLAAPE